MENIAKNIIKKNTENINENEVNIIPCNTGVLIKFYEERNIYNTYKKELEYCYVRYLYATFIRQATHFDEDEFNKAVKVAIENVKEHFPKYRKNKYFYRGIKGIYLVLFNKTISKLVYKMEHKGDKK